MAGAGWVPGLSPARRCFWGSLCSTGPALPPPSWLTDPLSRSLPGQLGPLEKTSPLKAHRGRGFVLVEAFWAFLKTKTGTYLSPELRSGLGASHCVQAAAGAHPAHAPHLHVPPAHPAHAPHLCTPPASLLHPSCTSHLHPAPRRLRRVTQPLGSPARWARDPAPSLERST